MLVSMLCLRLSTMICDDCLPMFSNLCDRASCILFDLAMFFIRLLQFDYDFLLPAHDFDSFSNSIGFHLFSMDFY